jgi:predicted RNA-binding Zn-ribbon protein involved in translation (DUF1610 family)
VVREFEEAPACPACGEAMLTGRFCRDQHPDPTNLDATGQRGDMPPHLHLQCPACGYQDLMGTKTPLE